MNSNSMSGFWKVPLLLAGFVLVTGCGKPVPKGPAFSLYAYQRLVVLPFANETRDEFLATAIEDQVAGRVANLRAIPVIESSQSEDFLKSLGADFDSAAMNEDVRNKIAAKFKSDLFMTGTVTSYEETLKDGDPERRVINSQTGEAQWGFNRYRRVDVAVTAKLIDPSTGSLLWKQSSTGWSYTNTWNPLPIPGSIMLPPIRGLNELIATAKVARDVIQEREESAKPRARGEKPLLYKKSQAFAGLRDDSLQNAANYLVGDFQGSGGWKPGKKAMTKR